MKTYKTVKVSRDEERLQSMTCDLCGKTTGRGSWANGSYETLETTVEVAEGSSYPDGGEKKTTEYHICPECFRGKLMPWLESQGAKPTHAETDW